MEQDQHLPLALLVLGLPLASSFMALAKERAMRNSRSGFAQAQGGSPSLQGAFDPSSHEFFGIKGHFDGSIIEGRGCSDPGLGSHLPPLTDPTNSSSRNSFVFGSHHWANSSSSVLSFGRDDRVYTGGHQKLDQGENCASWINNIDHDYQLNYHTESRVVQDENCFEMASNYGSMSDSMKYNRHGEDQFELLYSDDIIVDGLQETGVQVSDSQKHPYMGEHDMQAPKKHCGNGRKSKANPSTSKDPQSLAAKNRRERISERLRILQELVPNGTKVDLVTMLEKAISYVKFLQLQVKVLATDEFWPAQGGKAPEVAQVKEAIDAILASHKR